MILLPASDFTLDELTQAYNQTRTDYLIPMPMNPDRLNEYITLYDIDLHCSRVAVAGETIVGLAMLGRRGDQGWVTRLGAVSYTHLDVYKRQTYMRGIWNWCAGRDARTTTWPSASTSTRRSSRRPKT